MKPPPLDREPRSTALIAFKDCDAFGLLYNTRYLDYLMDGRAEHLIDNYDLDFQRELKRTNETWVVSSHQIAFIEPARVHERVVIRTRMLNYTRNTCLLEAQMLNADGVGLKAIQWTKLAYVSLVRNAPQNHPPELSEFLSQIVAQEDVPNPLDFDARVNEL